MDRFEVRTPVNAFAGRAVGVGWVDVGCSGRGSFARGRGHGVWGSVALFGSGSRVKPGTAGEGRLGFGGRGGVGRMGQPGATAPGYGLRSFVRERRVEPRPTGLALFLDPRNLL